MKGIRSLAFVCAFSITIMTGVNGVASALESVAGRAELELSKQAAEGHSYEAYYQKMSQTECPLLVLQGDCLNSEAEMDIIDGRKGVVLNDSGDWSEWEFEVSQSGAYPLVIEYYPLEGTGKDIVLSVALDGEIPFNEAETVMLPRIWADQADEQGQVIRRDSFGNDLRPVQVEKPRWVLRALADSRGMYENPYLFYVKAGKHKIRLTLRSEKMAIANVILQNAEIPSYEEYSKRQPSSSQYTGEAIRQEAEITFEKNSSMLYAVSDRSNAATLPSDPYNVRLNTIGQNNWNTVGQSITWKVDIPADGWYRLGFRARQNYNPGMTSYRTLYINGRIPFKEAVNIAFPYGSDWYNKLLGDDKSLAVYLHKGDTLTLECSPGPMSGILRRINKSVLYLNSIYRKIIIVTGANPDVYRDYQLEREIPGLLDLMAAERDELNSIASEILAITGKSSSQTATILQAALILDDFIKNSLIITERLSNFKGQIESLSSLLLSFGQQPLELDCIYFLPIDGQPPSAKPSFWQSVSYSARKFLASFMNDYNTMKLDSDSETINVWVATGRDQAQIINNMIDYSFTANTNIGVNLSLVDTGTTLIQATLAGKGPDLALSVNAGDVINFAMRGALANLLNYDLGSVLGQIYESAWTPFRYNGGLYAVPETQVFNMLFYRKDIFEELGLNPPNTWDEFYNVMQTLQNNNLVVGINEIDSSNQGISASIGIFDAFLFQRGGTYYNDSLTATQFDSTEAYEAFEEWAALYNEYKLPRQVDFFNRFRTGEMPMGITSCTMYNQLMASAPELRGLWAMTPIPGTKRPNGTIDRSQSSGGVGAMILSKGENRGVGQSAFKFLSWWTSAETQTRYGRELEAILGVAARYMPANRQAFEQMGWTEAESEELLEQWEWIRNVPPVPGNYMLARALTNALRASLETGQEPRRSLYLYNRDINSEIARKRIEFNLD